MGFGLSTSICRILFGNFLTINLLVKFLVIVKLVKSNLNKKPFYYNKSFFLL